VKGSFMSKAPMRRSRNLALFGAGMTLCVVGLASDTAVADVPACEPPGVTIVSPENGATVQGKSGVVTVKVNVTDAEMLSRVLLHVDGEEATRQSIKRSGDHELSVRLGPGSHTLEARAQTSCGSAAQSEAISVVMNEQLDGREEPDPDESAKRSTGPDDRGCAVSAVPSRTIVGLSAFALAVLGAWRLRRSGRVSGR
jgi:hypothetical protein